MRMPSELTSAELTKCFDLADALLELGECLPVRLVTVLDTFRADLAAEREDRAAIDRAGRQRALAAGRGHGDVRPLSPGTPAA